LLEIFALQLVEAPHLERDVVSGHDIPGKNATSERRICDNGNIEQGASLRDRVIENGSLEERKFHFNTGDDSNSRSVNLRVSYRFDSLVETEGNRTTREVNLRFLDCLSTNLAEPDCPNFSLFHQVA
jgi:hypothetical protein